MTILRNLFITIILVGLYVYGVKEIALGAMIMIALQYSSNIERQIVEIKDERAKEKEQWKNTLIRREHF